MAFSSSFFSSVQLCNACATCAMLVLVNELSASCAVLLYLSFFCCPASFLWARKNCFFLSVDRVSALLCSALLWSLCLCVSLCEQYTARPRTSPAIPAEPCGVHIWDWRGTVGPYTPFEGLTGISDLFWTLLYCIITECIVCCVVYGV